VLLHKGRCTFQNCPKITGCHCFILKPCKSIGLPQARCCFCQSTPPAAFSFWRDTSRVPLQTGLRGHCQRGWDRQSIYCPAGSAWVGRPVRRPGDCWRGRAWRGRYWQTKLCKVVQRQGARGSRNRSWDWRCDSCPSYSILSPAPEPLSPLPRPWSCCQLAPRIVGAVWFWGRSRKCSAFSRLASPSACGISCRLLWEC